VISESVGSRRELVASSCRLHTADADATQLDSFVASVSAVCIGLNTYQLCCTPIHVYRVFQKKTHTRVFFYISAENVSIYTKLSGYVCEELGTPSKSKLNIHCYCWRTNILSNVFLTVHLLLHNL